MNKIKIYTLFALLCLCFTNCTNSERKQRANQTKDLILETEHCRYYCIGRNGLGNCKVVVCECDEGYSCDTSNSW